MAYYRYWNNYSRNNRRQKDSFLQENKNLMSSERKSELDKLRKQYGDKIKEPLLEDFGLDEKQSKEISDFNNDIELKNKRIKEVNDKRYGHFVVFVWLPTFIIFLILIFNKVSNVSFILRIFFSICGGLFAGYAIFIIFRFLNLEKELLSYHANSSAMEKYNWALRGHKLFKELIEEERKDKEERQKREFWFSLNGFQFEKEVAKIFSKLGHKTEVTKGTGDGGVDVVTIDEQGSKTIIQCKAHKSSVGPHEVRALAGIRLHWKANQVILINLSGFTKQTEVEAERYDIELWDIKEILDLESKVSNFSEIKKMSLNHLDKKSENVDLQLIKKTDSNIAIDHNNLGASYSKRFCYAEAIESFKKAICIKPDFVEAHYNLGMSYSERFCYAEAIESFKKAICIKPDFTKAHYSLGMSYIRHSKDKDSALKEYEILKNLDDNLAKKLFNEIKK